VEDRKIGIDDQVSVDGLFEQYFSTQPETEWKKIQTYVYRKHIQPRIGLKRAISINRSHIDAIITSMKKEGAKPRTQKLILNVLRPMFRYAVEAQVLKDDPTQFIKVKIPKTKKSVDRPMETFTRLWNAIGELYADDPFNRAIFKFLILHGRRKSEVLTLRWSDIDFERGVYTLQRTKSGEVQEYILPETIAADLRELPRGESGYIFESPIRPGQPIKDIRGQVTKIRKASGVENFNPHYSRNILVSMLAERGADSIFLSSVLGHTDPGTIVKYLSIPTKKASEVAGSITSEIIDAG